MVFQSRIPELGQLSFSEGGGFNLNHKVTQRNWPLNPEAENFISKALNPRVAVFLRPAVMPQLLSPLAPVFRPQAVMKTRLNPQAEEYTPIQSHSSVLSPLAEEFSPSGSTTFEGPSLTCKSSLNAESMAFSPSPLATISPPSHTYYDGCLNDQPSLCPLVTLADGVADVTYEEKFRDLAIEAYMDVEFHGLGLSNEDLLEVNDDDFDSAVELEAALTRPATEHFLIPCMSLLPAGLVEMPILFAGSILSSSLSIREVNRSLCMSRGPLVRKFLANIEMPREFPLSEAPVYDIRVFELPDDHVSFSDRSWEKKKFICAKSALYQSETIIYDVPKIDASLKALRELDSYNNWADDTDSDEWRSSTSDQPRPRQHIPPQPLPVVTTSYLGWAEYCKPSEKTEHKWLYAASLMLCAIEASNGRPVARNVVRRVDDSLARLRALPSLRRWSDDVDDDTPASVVSHPSLEHSSHTVGSTLEIMIAPLVDSSPSQQVAAFVEEFSAIVQSLVEQDDAQDVAEAVQKESVSAFNDQDISFDIFKLPAHVDEPSNIESTELTVEMPVAAEQSVQGSLIELLKDISPVNNTALSFITDCIVRPLAIRKSSSPLVQSTLPSSSLEGSEVVIDDTKLDSAFSEDESVFDNDTDDYVHEFDIDVNPEARSSTPTPSASSSEDELEESIFQAESFSPIVPKQPVGDSEKQSSVIEEDVMAPSLTQSLPVAIQHDAESTETLPTIWLPSPPSPIVLPFRLKSVKGFNKPSSPKMSKPEQLLSFPGRPVLKPGESRIPRSPGFYPGSKKFRDLRARAVALNDAKKKERNSLSNTPPSGSKLPRPVEQQLSPPPQPSRKRHARFDKHRTSPLRQMQTIDEESESVPEGTILNTPEVVMEDLKDLGRRFQVKLAEAANSKPELSHLIDEDRASPPRSLIPVPASTRPANQPSQLRRAVGGQYDFELLPSPELETSSPFRRPESNTPTRMSRVDDRDGFTDFEEDASEYVHGKDGLSTIYEESYLAEDAIPSTPHLSSTHSKELVDPLSLESSAASPVPNNEQQHQTSEPLSIIEGQSPFRLPGKMHKDRITSGAWLSGGPTTLKDVAGPSIPPRSSSLLALTTTANIQPLPSTPTTTSMLGLNITTPSRSTSSSTHRLLTALAAATPTSTYHPDFEFWDQTHPAATLLNNEVPTTPIGFKTGIRGTPSVLKTWDGAFTAEGLLRSPAHLGKYHLRIIRSSGDQHEQSAVGNETSITSPSSPAELLMTHAVGVGEMSTSSMPRASDVAFEAMARGRGSGRRQPSRINMWYTKGIEKKLVKKQPLRKDRVVSGESAGCESAAATGKKEKKSFFGKMKKMFGLRSEKKE